MTPAERELLLGLARLLAEAAYPFGEAKRTIDRLLENCASEGNK